LLAEPLSVDGGEITDKGYVNQRAVLARRPVDVEDLNIGVSGRLIICASAEQYARHA
jgi:feruloyl-CoA synthase